MNRRGFFGAFFKGASVVAGAAVAAKVVEAAPAAEPNPVTKPAYPYITPEHGRHVPFAEQERIRFEAHQRLQQHLKDWPPAPRAPFAYDQAALDPAMLQNLPPPAAMPWIPVPHGPDVRQLELTLAEIDAKLWGGDTPLLSFEGYRDLIATRNYVKEQLDRTRGLLPHRVSQSYAEFKADRAAYQKQLTAAQAVINQQTGSTGRLWSGVDVGQGDDKTVPVTIRGGYHSGKMAGLTPPEEVEYWYRGDDKVEYRWGGEKMYEPAAAKTFTDPDNPLCYGNRMPIKKAEFLDACANQQEGIDANGRLERISMRYLKEYDLTVDPHYDVKVKA